MTGFAARRERLVAELAAAPGGATPRLGKATSNLFRDREAAPRQRLDVRAFSHVLEVDPARGWVDVEGMTPYETLADATLAHEVIPCVVPQLKSITIGGAVAGVGIEASSFKHGLVHETVLELEVLTGGGEVVVARPDNEHRDLFFGFPNSYGTLGYALRVKAKTVPVKPFVRLEHVHHADTESFFGNLAAACASAVDFVDGVAFGPNELVTTVGRFVNSAPYRSDYTYEHIYYRSLRTREEDFLATRDYLWRWDTDWFWCSRAFGAQRPVVRRLWPKRYLRSDVYWKIVALENRYHLKSRLEARQGRPPRERVVQDVEIPLGRLEAFLGWFTREVPIEPVWLCPIELRQTTTAPADGSPPWPLYPLRPGQRYVNVGFWSTVPMAPGAADGDINRLIEREVTAAGGHKSLYSDAYYDRATFERLYGGPAYAPVKDRYDPDGRLPSLYDKAVRRR